VLERVPVVGLGTFSAGWHGGAGAPRSVKRRYIQRMDLYKLAWLIWIGGTILIVLSWDGATLRRRAPEQQPLVKKVA
jgi:hypothetical protein